MANTKKFVAKNGLHTQNIDLKSPDSLSKILVTMLDGGVLSFNGVNGQLFSIADDMSGTIFSVNDISGVPSIEVDDDGTIRLAEFFGNTLIGTNLDDGLNKLQVIGGLSADFFTGDGTSITNVDAALLGGNNSAFYLNASNLNAGTIPAGRIDDISHGMLSGGSLHAAATPTVSGFMSAADKAKLDGIEEGAGANTVTSVNTLTGAVVLDTDDIGEGVTNKYTTTAEKNKLAGIETGAQVNTVDTVNSKTGAVVLSTTDIGEGTNLYYTNARAIAAIKGDAAWNATNWDTAYGWGNHANAGYELASNKGIANGYASLDANGKVPSTQLPSFVDDVLEFAAIGNFPVTGETGKIYVALDTNKAYRWSGSTYVYITSGAVDSVNGYTGVVSLTTSDIGEGTNLYFTNARARSAISVAGDLSYNASTGVITFNETFSTATDLLTTIKTVDGTGSGLDADLLDGQHASAFAAASHAHDAGDVVSGVLAAARIPTITTGMTDFTDQMLNTTSSAKFAILRTGGAVDDGVNNLQVSGGTRTDDLKVEGVTTMGDFTVQFNAATKSLDFNYVGA